MLLVGENSGYITALTAQIVGKEGKVVNISTCKDNYGRCQKGIVYSPLENTMQWIKVRDIHNINKSQINSEVEEVPKTYLGKPSKKELQNL